VRLKRSLTLAATTAIAAAGAIFALSSPAAAEVSYEINNAVSSGTPTGSLRCSSITGAKACYKADGDVLYILDTAADGASAVFNWSMFPKNSGGDFTRWGECRNKLGSGEWGVCNKNFPEDATVNGGLQVYDFGSKKEIRSGGYFTMQN
jgi:hypothetical protein